ncbi:hypothetical protein GCM10011380_04410 [Sphingomonas metalli]|uniref:Uncharacterized protein n=1 Tax=Sphingomonas metalli TaxID=1779358 RepID=A0A916SV53_9SPHN|nr:hypothetical protein [Sphingomonas metalli]GGB17990.1 hypothetical protein GCM10011380_04410 [Sphingomonas metalli]
MSYAVGVMYVVAAVLATVGIALLVSLAGPSRTERQVYAFRMIGIMATAAGIVLAMSATAMWRWSVTP